VKRVTKVTQDLKEYKAKLALLGCKVSKDQLVLVAYLVTLELRVLKALQDRLDNRVQLALKESKAKLDPEVLLVQKAIRATLVLLDHQEPQEPQV
jgi:hypothetical protein